MCLSLWVVETDGVVESEEGSGEGTRDIRSKWRRRRASWRRVGEESMSWKERVEMGGMGVGARGWVGRRECAIVG